MSIFVFGGMRAGMRSFAMVVVCFIHVASPFSITDAQAGDAYSIAKRYAGLHEAKHTRKLTKAVGVNPRRTPWCGAFVGAVVKRAGKPGAEWIYAGGNQSNQVKISGYRAGSIRSVRRL